MNNKSKITTNVHPFSFVAKPRIEGCSSTPVKLIKNERSSISCRAKGWPTPTTKWIFKNKIVSKELEGVSIYKNSLGYSRVIIERMSSQLEGSYIFVAENKLGSRTKELRVYSIPQQGRMDCFKGRTIRYISLGVGERTNM